MFKTEIETYFSCILHKIAVMHHLNFCFEIICYVSDNEIEFDSLSQYNNRIFVRFLYGFLINDFVLFEYFLKQMFCDVNN